MGDDRPIRYLDPDGTVVYRASGLGACDGVILGLAAGRKPNAIPQWLQEVFDEGHTAEPMILDELLALDPHSGLKLDTQSEWTLEIGEINDRMVVVRGHSDGWDGETRTLVECKKFRDSTWPKFQSQGVECSPLYPWQVSVYMHASEADECLFIGGHWDGEGVSEIGIFRLTNPPIPLRAIQRRIAPWENMIAEGTDVSDLTEPCKPAMFPCAMFGKGCPNELPDTENTLIVEDEDDLVILRPLVEAFKKEAEMIRTAREVTTAADKRKKLAEDGIRAWCEARGVDPKKLNVDGVTVTHIKSEVAEHMVKASTRDYFQIKATKEA